MIHIQPNFQRYLSFVMKVMKVIDDCDFRFGYTQADLDNFVMGTKSIYGFKIEQQDINGEKCFCRIPSSSSSSSSSSYASSSCQPASSSKPMSSSIFTTSSSTTMSTSSTLLCQESYRSNKFRYGGKKFKCDVKWVYNATIVDLNKYAMNCVQSIT